MSGRAPSGYTRGYRAALIAVLGGKCEKCPARDTRLLQIDHREGGGTRHRRETGGNDGGGLMYYRKIAADLRTVAGRRKYRALCANHNVLARASRRRT